MPFTYGRFVTAINDNAAAMIRVKIMKTMHFSARYGCIAVALALVLCSAARSSNIDPGAEEQQWAWSENAGWINFDPSRGIGVTVGDAYVTGYVWGENIGWINLNPAGFGGVTNDGYGELGGWAWGENVGWISFSCTATGTCDRVDYGVTVDPDGRFDGWAWGENIGWISFSLPGVSEYRVATSWQAGSTLITLASFDAASGRCSVMLRWQTASEVDCAGFNLYRSDSHDGEYEQINEFPIPAEGSPAGGAAYSFVDGDVHSRSKYYYLLEDIDLSGSVTMHGPVSALAGPCLY